MIEGWTEDDDHWIVFDETEAAAATEAYALVKWLPGYSVVAILGWDDFVVRDQQGGLFQVPTVPLDRKYLEMLDSIPDPAGLEADERFNGKIKWYVTPLIFGGDPGSEENVFWANHQQHQELVRWWNDKYLEADSSCRA